MEFLWRNVKRSSSELLMNWTELNLNGLGSNQFHIRIFMLVRCSVWMINSCKALFKFSSNLNELEWIWMNSNENEQFSSMSSTEWRQFIWVDRIVLKSNSKKLKWHISHMSHISSLKVDFNNFNGINAAKDANPLGTNILPLKIFCGHFDSAQTTMNHLSFSTTKN